MTTIQEVITKMEFHEFTPKTLTIPFVELYCYVNDIPTFIALCDIEEWKKDPYGLKAEYDYYMGRMKKSKAKRPHFDLHLNDMRVTIYPKENLIVAGQAGIHYIGQHIFDFLPYEERDRYRPILERFDFIIGKLYTKDNPEGIDVHAHDVHTGFMNSREENLKYNDTFSIWIKSQNEKWKRRCG